MKLAIFERSTSATRPDAHVIAVSVPGGLIDYCNKHQAQHIMEKVGMTLNSGISNITIDFGNQGYHQATHEYARQLVNDLQFALQEWADYVNG